ncbi:MAG TPA: hypothetical protein VF577_06860 [Allosphingosinicella sp.]|jgi:hypothetical protein
MTDLPRLVQRAPTLFYGAAVLYFVASVVLTHLQLENAFQGGEPGRTDGYTRLALLSAWLQAAEGALYLAANGVIAQILLAIWRDGRGRTGGGGQG